MGYEINKGAAGCIAGAEIISNLLQLQHYNTVNVLMVARSVIDVPRPKKAPR